MATTARTKAPRQNAKPAAKPATRKAAAPPSKAPRVAAQGDVTPRKTAKGRQNFAAQEAMAVALLTIQIGAKRPALQRAVSGNDQLRSIAHRACRDRHGLPPERPRFS